MKKILILKINQIITLIALFCCNASNSWSQSTCSISPYAIFGNSSKILEPQKEFTNEPYQVQIITANGEKHFIDFDFKKGTATLSNDNGYIIQQDSMNEYTRARFISIDPYCEKYYNISPYAYCAGNPINRVDLHGDSITILDAASIEAIYNALQPGTNLSMRFNNGVLVPESIQQVASNSQDLFLQDLYSISINPQMIELATTSTNDYYMNNKFYSDQWNAPSDIDYAKEYDNGLGPTFYPSGKTILGNLGQTLYPISSNELKRTNNNNIRININGRGNLNQRSCGIAHEFAHVILYLNGLPHSHGNNGKFIYERQWNVMKRFGYDYVDY